MAFLATGGSFNVSTTEVFLVSSSTTQTPQTTPCRVQWLIRPDTMIAGDAFRFRVYEKINGTQVVIYEYPLVGVTPSFFTPEFQVSEGWEASLLRTAGADRVINWSTRKDTNGANVDTVTAGAITAAAFATDSIAAAAIAAGAVTKIQAGLGTGSAQTTLQTSATDIQSRLPAALDGSGNMKSGVLTMATGSIVPGTMAAGSIVNATMAAGAISAATFASGAINTTAISATAVGKIQLGLALTADVTAIQASIAGVQADTDAIQTALAGSIVTAIADAIFGFVEEPGAEVGARTFHQRRLIEWSVMQGPATGLTDAMPSPVEVFMSADGTKPRAAFAIDVDGTRTPVPGSFDGD